MTLIEPIELTLRICVSLALPLSRIGAGPVPRQSLCVCTPPGLSPAWWVASAFGVGVARPVASAVDATDHRPLHRKIKQIIRFSDEKYNRTESVGEPHISHLPVPDKGIFIVP